MFPKMASELALLSIIAILIPVVVCQCPEKNGRFPVGNQCDAYLECRDGVPKEHMCPDGLAFNADKTRLNTYPCDYVAEVDCGSRSALQPAQSTEHCPHRYGLYLHEDKRNCGQFWNCADGRAYLFDCPEGLAFHGGTLRCEWPDEAPDCNAEDYLGFKCPPADPLTMDAFLNNPRYPHPSDCSKFYVCIDGTKPRLLTCQSGFGYNSELKACDQPENIPGCKISANSI